MKLIRLLDRIIEVAAVFAFAVSSILIGINVFNRYVISGGLRNLAKQFESLQPLYLICREWFGSISVLADEVPGLLLVWIAFLGAYLAMRRDGHIAFDLLARRVGAAGQRFLALMNAA
ncbi:MAG: TRAP transporter small permease subunit, partial [Burkholderiaceae bacterium]